jgi:hypothetical protein
MRLTFLVAASHNPHIQHQPRPKFLCSPVRRPLFILICVVALTLASCSVPTSAALSTQTAVPTGAPTVVATANTATLPSATAVSSTPFTHTACAPGVDLSGQSITFYHLTDAKLDLIQPAQLGLADASDYFNAHGGICGARLDNNFPDPNTDYVVFSEYARATKLNPRPVLIGLYSTQDAENLGPLLARDQIPALGIRMAGSVRAFYGDDGQTPGWIFSTNPDSTDQLGAFCRYAAQHPQQFPIPTIGFLS